MLFSLRNPTDADTATGLVPDPGAGEHGAVKKYTTVAPYSKKHSLTSPPFGFTLPFSVTVVGVSDEAAMVSTLGGFGVVVNVWSVPVLVPPWLLATIRKW